MLATLVCSIDPIPQPQLLRSTSTRKFDERTTLFLLQTCQNIKHLKQIHAHITRTDLFHHFPSTLTFTCNLIIRGYALNGSPCHAFLLYILMLQSRILPDKFTFPFLIKACIHLGSPAAVPTGRAVHTHVVKTGFAADVYVQNTLMDLYLKWGDLECGKKVFDQMRVRNVVSWTTMVSGLVARGELETACAVFDEMPVRNVVSWTALIDGYVRNGRAYESFELFRQMQAENVQPNEFTLVSLLLACTELESFSLGSWVHELARKNGFQMGVFLGTALIDMYSKCGSVEDAMKVFNEMPERSLATWNSMITSLGVHGHGKEALALFNEMNEANVRPDTITFVGVLCACLNASLVDEGCEFFKIMIKQYGITPTLEHYSCMIELLGRAGLWDHAHELAKSMVGKLDVNAWRTLLRACETHGNTELREVAHRRIVELDPMNGSMPNDSNYLAQENNHCFDGKVE